MTGLRLKDCCLLQWSEVDLNAGTIERVPAKTKRFGNKKVVIPIPPALHRILSSIERNGSPCVNAKLAERYQTHKRELIAEIQNHIEGCGIRTRGEATAEGLRAPTVKGFHSFRHFFISATLQTGAPLISVRKMVGHSSAWMTDRYSHLLDLSDSRKAVGLLAQSIDNTKPTRTPQQVISDARALVESMTKANFTGQR